MALTDEQRAFLEAPNFGVLATTNLDGTTQQTLMWYGLFGDEIVMNAAAGRRKLCNIQERPDVSICVVHGRQYVTVLSGRGGSNPNRFAASVVPTGGAVWTFALMPE